MTEEYNTQTPNRSRSFEENVIDRLGRIETRIDYIESNIRDCSTDKKQVNITLITAICSTMSAIVAAGVCYIIGFGVI